MKWRIRDKRAARKATGAAQAAAVLLFASGAAMAMFGPNLLEVEEPEAAGPAPRAGLPPVQTSQAETRSFDATIVSDNLSYLANKPVPDPEPEVEVAEEETPTTAGDAQDVRYVGAVRVGDRMAAFLNIAGVTKMLRPGQEHEGVQVVSITEDEIVVAIDGGAEQSIQKAERAGPAVTVVVGGAPEPEPTQPTEPGGMVAGEGADSPRFTPEMSREERRAMLLERAREERSRWERDRGERGERVAPDRIDN